MAGDVSQYDFLPAIENTMFSISVLEIARETPIDHRMHCCVLRRVTLGR